MTKVRALDEILKDQPVKLSQVAPETRGYPSRVEKVPYGKCLKALRDLPAGTVVEKFEGIEVDYSTVHGDHKNYVLNYAVDAEKKDYSGWMYVTSPAKYANHSCDPNSRINDNLEIETKRPVKAGEEITFIYNNSEETDEWDPDWTFKCECGAIKCQGMIDKYQPFKC